MGDAGKMGREHRRTAACPGCGKGLDLIPRVMDGFNPAFRVFILLAAGWSHDHGLEEAERGSRRATGRLQGGSGRGCWSSQTGSNGTAYRKARARFIVPAQLKSLQMAISTEKKSSLPPRDVSGCFKIQAP